MGFLLSLSLSHSSYILISHILSRFLHIQKTFFIKKNSLSHAPFLVCTSLSSKYEIMFGQLLQTFGEFLLVTLFLTHTYQHTLYLSLARSHDSLPQHLVTLAPSHQTTPSCRSRSSDTLLYPLSLSLTLPAANLIIIL